VAARSFASFRDFYPYYLGEHTNRTSRRLHYLGTTAFVAFVVAAVIARDWRLAAIAPLLGYGPAWIGHFFFERNRPATFRHPFYSLIGDFAMLRDFVLGRIPW
jgi:hypothetical protein